MFEIKLIGTVQFNHTVGCQKCTVVGRYFKQVHRMSFLHSDCEMRSDKSFRDRTHQSHHKENSLIENLPIDMVLDFKTSDSLHLLHLGVMKKCILTWMNGDVGYESKWTTKEKQEISELLVNTNKELPSEIHRSVRPLKDISFWKGTEYRTVMLYIGMVVFKNYLPKDVYDHFMLLMCCVTICSTDEYKQFLPKVREMFEEYVELRKELYGPHSITSNFHNLIHIVGDIEKFGHLEYMSTYKFENLLGLIKSRLKLCKKPLEQIARRLIELSYTQADVINLNETFIPNVKYRFRADDSSLIAFNDIYIRRDVLISNRKYGNKWFLTTDKQIVEMLYVFVKNNEYYIHGTPIIDKRDYFTYPFSSRYINIFESNLLEGNAMDFKLDTFKAKLICLSTSNSHVFIPLLHSFKN